MSSYQQKSAEALFKAWLDGDLKAREEIVRRFHEDLRRLASSKLRKESDGITLETGDVLNEVIVRIFGNHSIRVEDEIALKALSATIMQNVLVDHARRKGAQKRSGIRVQLTEADGAYEPTAYELLDLDNAIKRLRHVNDLASRVIVLRFFGGLTISDTSVHLGIAVSQVRSAQAAGESWLKDAIENVL